MVEEDAPKPLTQVAEFLRDHPMFEPQIDGHGPPGWDEPVAQALTEIAALSEAAGTTVRIDQIKEKFGRLRIQLHVDEPSATGSHLINGMPGHDHFRTGALPGSVSDAVQRIVDAAAQRAGCVCIRCGGPATRTLGLYRFCDLHTSVYR